MISKILPDNEMPIMVENGTGKKKVVEVVMNPYSTINRGNNCGYKNYLIAG